MTLLSALLAAYSYRDTTWLSFDDLMEHKAQLLRNFITRHNPDEQDPELEDGVHPDWLLVERVIAHKGNAKVGQLDCRRGVPTGRLRQGDAKLGRGVHNLRQSMRWAATTLLGCQLLPTHGCLRLRVRCGLKLD